MVFAIITIILVSVFAFTSKGNNSAPETVPQSTDSPTASPTITPQETTKPTINPTKKPEVFSGMKNFFTGIAEAITPKPPGTVESAIVMNSTVWRKVAANAWNYFQPGTGVDSNTGLPYAGGTDSPNFTDWDLGVYIQAVIDAQKIGVIGTDGTWNSSNRLETVLRFLETRELNSTTHYPYWFYQARDGKAFRSMSDISTASVDCVDTGRLFVALNNLRIYNSSLATRINNIVLYGQLYNRSDYAAIVPSLKSESASKSIYAYYYISGYASFWPDELSNVPNQILNNIISANNVTTNGVALPNAELLADPLLGSVFESNNNPNLNYVMRQFYLAHEAYYNATGIYRAFSEGGTLSDHWAYEWVVLPENRTWVVLDERQLNFGISPIIYTKAAIGFLALNNNATFAKNMVVFLERALPDPTRGYCEGMDEAGNQLTGVGDHTNGLILGSALYAIKHNP